MTRITLATFAILAPLWSQPARLSIMDALETTLSHHPQLKIAEHSVEAGRAISMQKLGAFDPLVQGAILQTRANQPLQSATSLRYQSRSADLTNFEGSASRLLRNGMSVESFVGVNRAGGTALPIGLSTGELAFQVRVPLLRGRGRTAVESELTAAGLEVDARLLGLNQTISDLLAQTAASYWQYAASLRTLQVVSESETRGKVYIENVQELIEADRIPRNDMYQVRANLSSRSAARAAVGQMVTEARQELALAMGLRETDLASFGDPLEELPEPRGLERLDAKSYVEQAVARRADLLALAAREQSAHAIVEGKVNGLRPRVDLLFRTGYSGFRQGAGGGDLAGALFQGVRGMDAIGGVTYQFPRGNHLAKGQLGEAQANLKIAGQRKADLSRTIVSNVVTAVAAVETAAGRLKQMQQTVADFRLALAGEREKYQLGRSSLIDVLTLEDRLTSASMSEVDAHLAYALAVVRLRQATATIVAPRQQTHTLSRETFSTLPSGKE